MDSATSKLYVTPSIAPARNALITVAVLTRRKPTPQTPTLTGGGMSAWTLVTSVDFNPIGTPAARLMVFRAMSAAPGSGPLTLRFANSQNNVHWSVSQWTGVDQSGTNGSGAIGQTGSARGDAVSTLSVALAPFGNPNNVAYGLVGAGINGPGVTPGAGFTEISETSSGEGTLLEAECAVNVPTLQASLSKATQAAALGMEIKGGVAIASITMSPLSASVEVGHTVQLTATALDAAGNPLPGWLMTWTSTSVTVATVDGSGLVTGVGTGQVTITATSEGQSATSTITVTGQSVASVDVTPGVVSLELGTTAQLVATPKDNSENPLTGRLVTWGTGDAGVATVSPSGLVMGVALGVTTITATSEGQSGTAAVTVIAPVPCLARTGPTITVSGVQTTAYSNTALADNTKIDASTAQFMTPAIKPVVVGGGSGACFHGGETVGGLPPSTDWNTMHDTYAFQVKGIPRFALEGIREFDYGDGVTLDDTATNWIIRGVYFKYMRDDCVQNDWLNNGLIEDALFDGCYEGFSSRPFATTQDGSGNLVVVKNSLFRLQDMDQGYASPGHGGFFKWSATGPMVSLYGNVYRVDSPSNLGSHSLGPPAGKLKDCANNVMIWLGSGPFPEALPSCYTLLTGAAGLAYWNNAVDSWKTNHPNSLPDVGPPIVSLLSPPAGATLTGLVTLTATAVDDRDLVGVQFQLDGQNIGAEVTTESPVTKFTLSWDSNAWPSGSHTLTAVARDASGNSKASVGLPVTIGTAVSPALSSVDATPTSLSAGDAATITVIVRDASGAGVSGASVTLSATGSGNSITQPAPTDGSGMAIGTLRSTVAGVKSITATANNVILSQQPAVTVTAGPPSATASLVSANPTIFAAGTGSTTIAVTVNDAYGNPVVGSNVTLSANGTGNTFTPPFGVTSAAGTFTASLSSTDVQTETISAKADNVPLGQTPTVSVTSQPTGGISHALLSAGVDTATLKIYGMPSIAPAPNALITVTVLARRSSGAQTPTLAGGGMATWTLVTSVDYNPLGTPASRLMVFRAMSGSPGSGPLTMTFANSQNNVQWSVSQWTRVDLTGTNGSGAIGQIGSARSDAAVALSVTLAAFGNPNNVAYGLVGAAINGPAVAPGAGFTEIGETSSGEATLLETQWAINQPVVQGTLSKAAQAAALAIEIKAP